MDDDWDLQAVVRGCCATATTSSTSTSTTSNTTTTTTTTSATPSCAVGFHSFSSFQPQQVQEEKLFCFQDLFEPRRNESTIIEELHDLYKPFFPKPSPQPLSPQSVPVSPLSVLGGFQDLSSSQHLQQQQQKQQQIQLQQQPLLQTQLHQPKQFPAASGVPKSSNTIGSNGTTHIQSPRSKRRKNQMKRVCQVPAEGLSSDMWSWRKYGQKPIKGSPYPRGYYRCSTSKGCLARKQVERNRSDPNMFIVTYTAEHNHPTPTQRNSLAGSTRQKSETPQTANSGDANKPTSSPPAASLSPAPENLESSREEKEDIIEEDDDDFGISDIPLDDDFFAGLGDELTGPGPAHDDCFSDHFPATTQFTLLSNSATTAAGGG